MNAAGRLAAFGVGLAVAFGAAYTTAAALAPAPAPQQDTDAPPNPLGSNDITQYAPAAPMAGAPAGLSLADDGYELSPVRAPARTDATGLLSFSILNPAGQPLRDYDTVHDKQLHLIVVRTDGNHFAHVHPSLDPRSGVWSIPWTWNAAGTYRVFTDFTPAGGKQTTLTRAVEVAGTFTPSPARAPRTVDQVDGYTVQLQGTLAAGTSTQLTARITRDGQPVTTLEPYLGAFGHLVALRDGDLAYLHVHPEGAEPTPGDSGGPTVPFAATAPTAGRYLLYLDFQVRDTVHTATFVVDAARSGPVNSTTAPSPAPGPGHAGHTGH
ncbi:heavy-metal-associated domain-containing protein [Mycobacterium sp. AMU20-3851]|uniref:heavy-metal-associated domain-containing protein n=1 Tax=Mycobacterium sp. AMU20-3851 TaxID=3122055 RepID=UPI003753EB48